MSCLLTTRTHHTAPPRPPLVASSRADTLLPLRTDAALSERHRPAYLADGIHRATAVVTSARGSRRPARSSIHARRPGLPCRRSTGVVQSAVGRPSYTITRGTETGLALSSFHGCGTVCRPSYTVARGTKTGLALSSFHGCGTVCRPSYTVTRGTATGLALSSFHGRETVCRRPS